MRPLASSWEQRKLGEVAHRVIRKNEGNQSDLPLTISAQHGLVDQRDYFNNQVASRDMSGYYLLENGEFAYNKSTSGDSPWGAIKRLTKYEKGCLSTLYICFGLDLGDPDFLVTYYETNRWHGAVQMIAAEGARNHGLLNIAPDDFFETVLTLPCSTEEQKQIGCFFTQLNSLITLHQCKCQHCSLCGYLSWEQRKFSDVAVIRRGLTYSPTNIVDGADGVRVLRSSNINEDHFVLNDDDVFVDEGAVNIDLVRDGDILITAANGSPRLVGKRARISDLPGKTVHGGFMLVASSPCSDFLCASMGSSWYRRFLATGVAGGNGAIGNLDSKALGETTIAVPNDAEIDKLGNFFTCLDSLITLHR